MLVGSFQHETPVAIGAIDMSPLVDFQPDARMTQGGTACNIGSPIAADAGGAGKDCFGCFDHGPAH